MSVVSGTKLTLSGGGNRLHKPAAPEAARCEAQMAMGFQAVPTQVLGEGRRWPGSGSQKVQVSQHLLHQPVPPNPLGQVSPQPCVCTLSPLPSCLLLRSPARSRRRSPTTSSAVRKATLHWSLCTSRITVFNPHLGPKRESW